MKGVRWLVVLVVVALALVAAAAAVMAQDEVPPPYTGLQNPFSWDDAQAQAAGLAVYRGSCLGCHAPIGDGITQADFATAEFTASLEAEPDFYFYVVSEGMLSHGMPSFKGSLSDEQRWQVLTYIHTLSSLAPEPTTTPEPTPTITPVPEGTTMQLAIPERALSGHPVDLIVALKDPAAEPIADAAVSFSYRVTFFAEGTFEIGQAVTDDRGIATLEYTPRQLGPITLLIDYQDLHEEVPVELVRSDETYRVDIGVRLPQIAGGQVNFGPPSSMHLDEQGSALNTGFRLPGGLPSWLLLFVGTIGLIWFTYFRVAFQMFRIAPAANEEVEGPRHLWLVPTLIMMFVAAVGVVLLLMIATGPNSQLHAM